MCLHLNHGASTKPGAIHEYIKSNLKETGLWGVYEDYDEFSYLMLKIRANIVAFVQSLHAVADTCSHMLYYSLALDKLPRPLKERDIYANEVLKLLEQQRDAGHPEPYFIQPTQAPVFGFAGLWERWNQADGSPLDTFTVITTAANEAMREIHERMPVILAPTDFAAWLSRDTPADALLPLLRPCHPGWLQLHPVAKAVGNIRNESAELIAPLSVPES